MLKRCSDGQSDHEVWDVRKPASKGEVYAYAAERLIAMTPPPAGSKSRI